MGTPAAGVSCNRQHERVGGWWTVGRCVCGVGRWSPSTFSGILRGRAAVRRFLSQPFRMGVLFFGAA